MKFLVFLSLVAQIIGISAHAETPTKEILEIFDQRLNDLTTPESFKSFVQSHPDLFPPLQASTENLPSMIVKKEELSVNDEDYTIAIGYRQVAIRGSAEFLNSLWATPELFQKVYNLDGESKIEDETFKNSKNTFRARIYKKIPAIEDQNYVLEYTIEQKDSFTFIRARLHKDENNFALRDNLKVMEETKDGLLIVREISYLYPLKWYVRALGGAARNIMKSELNKISLIEKCLTEQSKAFPPSEDVIQKCIKD